MRHPMQPLLSPAAHAAGIAAAVAIIAATTAFAGRASEDAVHYAQAALSPSLHDAASPTVAVAAARRAGEGVATSCARDAAPT